MYLVTQGKRKENQLAYAPKTQEYVYYHLGKEIWREKGDDSLLKAFTQIRNGDRDFDDTQLEKEFPIYKKYGDDCHKFELEQWKRMGI